MLFLPVTNELYVRATMPPLTCYTEKKKESFFLSLYPPFLLDMFGNQYYNVIRGVLF